MADKPLTVLVTNDDGIHADGLETLEKIARTLTDEVWIVAPEVEQSGASHSLSLANPIRLRRLDDRRFAVQGTPADCVLMALRKVMPRPPDLVLSGVNRGQNLADDVTYSGTIAAAMEGTALGLPSIALSQSYGVHSEGRLRFEVAEVHGPELVRRLAKVDLGPGILVEERIDTRSRPYFWLGFKRDRSDAAPGTDLRAIYDRWISVTPLHMNMTQLEAIDVLRTML
jgi:5'/3'-nucleotidase